MRLHFESRPTTRTTTLLVLTTLLSVAASGESVDAANTVDAASGVADDGTADDVSADDVIADDATLVEPSPQAMVYYNARVALREGRHQDVLKLWLLRNALEYKGEEPEFDGDFRSAVWVALSGAGLCHDGIPEDEHEGVGLWPLALHNWLVRSTSKQPAPGQPRSFTSFDSGFQQRVFSLYDVLSVEELNGIRFMRRNCLRPYLALPLLGTPHWLDLDDRLSTGIMMRDLIIEAQSTLQHERVRGQVVLETRLFDIDVALGRLAKAAARRDTTIIGQVAKTTGVSESAMTLLREKRLAEVRESNYADLLRRCLTWDALSWFSLSQKRRLALFAEALDSFASVKEMEAPIRRTLLQNIDSLIEEKEGAELEQWLGFISHKAISIPLAYADAAPTSKNDVVTTPAASPQGAELVSSVVLGDRGEKLLGLGPESGFRERAVVALWRGIDFLQRGKPLDAMRSFALSMHRAEESRRVEDVHNQAKRWFSYVLAQHDADDESLAILNEFVAPLDRNDLLEILLWRAAFHVDVVSFDRITEYVRKGGALDFRIRQLRTLATGDAGKMWMDVREELKDSPPSIVKFAGQLTEELATESLDVRHKNRATIELGREVLIELTETAPRGLQKRIDRQVNRMQTLLDSLDLYDESPEGRARNAAPGSEAYAGSLRLAPGDPLPWPFSIPRVQPPSPFSAIQLTPVEWIDDDGRRVLGWHIHEK